MMDDEPRKIPKPTDSTELSPRAAFADAAEPLTDVTAPPTPPGAWSPPSIEELAPFFPAYTIEKQLGRGGMGAVYKAVQLNLERPVAIKILPSEFAADATFADRFRHEAKAMAQLDHPNIVHIYDFGEPDNEEEGYYYFVMEFVDGMDFHDLIHTGQLDPQGALNAVSQICDALNYAHEKGFVHRDIKPANIFINQAGLVKVGDFGLAKLVEEATDSNPSFTVTGQAVGTPFYSAPEQLKGAKVDQRADIYSLGVMFYEMLTGEIPRGGSAPPSKKVQIDVRIDEVVFRAMQSEPELRYQTAVEVRTDVDGIRDSQSMRIPDEPAIVEPKRNWMKWWAAGIAIAVAVAFGVFFPHFFPSVEPSPKIGQSELGETPLPLPEFPPRLANETPCRLVIVKVDQTADDELWDWQRAIRQDDFADIVSIFSKGPTHLRVLRASGEMARWSKDSPDSAEKIVAMNDAVSYLGFGRHSYEAILDRTGQVSIFPPAPHLDPSWLTNISAICQWGNQLVSLDRFGVARVINLQDTKSELPEQQLENVRSIPITSSRPSILFRNGDWIRPGIEEGPFPGPDASGTLRLFNAELGVSQSGELVDWFIPSPKNHRTRPAYKGINANDIKWAEASSYGGVISLGLQDGTVRVALRDWDNPRESFSLVDPEISAALEGAENIIPFRKSNAGDHRNCSTHLLALLPADSVPRSGYWDAEELLAARQALNDKRQEVEESLTSPNLLPLPTYPPQRPSVPCRVVILPFGDGVPDTRPSYIDAVDESDWVDVVSLGHQPQRRDSLVVLRANGAIQALGTHPLVALVSDLETHPRTAQFAAPDSARICVLSDDGALTLFSPHEERQLGKNVAQISLSGYLFALREDGRLEAFDSETFERVSDPILENVSQFGTEYGRSSSALLRDGNWTRVRVDLRTEKLDPSSRYTELIGGSVARHSDGRPRYYGFYYGGGSMQTRLDQWDDRDVSHASENLLGSKLKASDGSWLVHWVDRTSKPGQWKRMDILSQAIQGAVEVQFRGVMEFEGGENEVSYATWLVALLPAETVPRSGFWLPEELLEARKMSGAADGKVDGVDTGAALLSLPEFPPKRPTVKCRIVYLPLPGTSKTAPIALQPIDREDPNDVVYLQKGHRGTMSLSGILADGRLRAWGIGRSAIDDVKFTNAVGCLNQAFSEWALTEEGNMVEVVAGDSPDHSLRKGVSKIGREGPHCLILDRFGKLTFLRQEDGAFEERIFEDVVDFALDPRGFSILYRNGLLESVGPNQTFTGARQLLGHQTARLSDGGRIMSRYAPFNELIAAEPLSTEEEAILSNLEDGYDHLHFRLGERWRLYAKADGSYSRLPATYEDAAQFAEDLQWISLNGNQDEKYLVMLLPAETVPRSGFWLPEELVEARRPLL